MITDIERERGDGVRIFERFRELTPVSVNKQQTLIVMGVISINCKELKSMGSSATTLSPSPPQIHEKKHSGGGTEETLDNDKFYYNCYAH